MGRKIEITHDAYVKLGLHALKYKACSVNGVLIGSVGSSPENEGNLEITDSIPLFHTHLGLLPMLELALGQIDEYLAKYHKELTIVGYYHANERYDDQELSAIAKKIADHIARYCPAAIILMVDNKLLEKVDLAGSKSIYQLYTRDASRGGWRTSSEPLLLINADANNVLFNYKCNYKQAELVDFEDHLEDIKLDWLNSTIFK